MHLNNRIDVALLNFFTGLWEHDAARTDARRRAADRFGHGTTADCRLTKKA
jgi:hypothetical protein